MTYCRRPLNRITISVLLIEQLKWDEPHNFDKRPGHLHPQHGLPHKVCMVSTAKAATMKFRHLLWQLLTKKPSGGPTDRPWRLIKRQPRNEQTCETAVWALSKSNCLTGPRRTKEAILLLRQRTFNHIPSGFRSELGNFNEKNSISYGTRQQPEITSSIWWQYSGDGDEKKKNT